MYIFLSIYAQTTAHIIAEADVIIDQHTNRMM